MPITLKEDDSLTPLYDAPDAPVKMPSWLDALGATWRQNTIAGTVYRSLPELGATIADKDPAYKGTYSQYDPWPDIPDAYRLKYWDKYVHANNKLTVNAITRQLQQEEADRQVNALMPWTGQLGFNLLAQPLSPESWIPGIVTLGTLKMGGNILKAAATGAISATEATAVQELGLRSTQAMRTNEESLANLGMAPFFGAALGGFGGTLHSLWTSRLPDLSPAGIAKAEAQAGKALERELTVPGLRYDLPDWHNDYTNKSAAVSAAVFGSELPDFYPSQYFNKSAKESASAFLELAPDTAFDNSAARSALVFGQADPTLFDANPVFRATAERLKRLENTVMQRFAERETLPVITRSLPSPAEASAHVFDTLMPALMGRNKGLQVIDTLTARLRRFLPLEPAPMPVVEPSQYGVPEGPVKSARDSTQVFLERNQQLLEREAPILKVLDDVVPKLMKLTGTNSLEEMQRAIAQFINDQRVLTGEQQAAIDALDGNLARLLQSREALATNPEVGTGSAVGKSIQRKLPKIERDITDAQRMREQAKNPNTKPLEAAQALQQQYLESIKQLKELDQLLVPESRAGLVEPVPVVEPVVPSVVKPVTGLQKSGYMAGAGKAMVAVVKGQIVDLKSQLVDLTVRREALSPALFDAIDTATYKSIDRQLAKLDSEMNGIKREIANRESVLKQFTDAEKLIKEGDRAIAQAKKNGVPEPEVPVQDRTRRFAEGFAEAQVKLVKAIADSQETLARLREGLSKTAEPAAIEGFNKRIAKVENQLIRDSQLYTDLMVTRAELLELENELTSPVSKLDMLFHENPDPDFLELGTLPVMERVWTQDTVGFAPDGTHLGDVAFEKLTNKIFDTVVGDMPTLYREKLFNNWLFKAWDPMMQTLTSVSGVTRQVVLAINETPLKLVGGLFKIPAQALYREYKGQLFDGLVRLDQGYKAYMADAGKGWLARQVGPIVQPDKNLMSFGDFKAEVSRALRQGGQHDNPFVAQVANDVRNKVFQPALKKAVELGFFEPDMLENGMTYLTRIWDVETIRADFNNFVERNLDWLKRKEMQLPEPLRRSEAQLRDIANRLAERIANRAQIGKLDYSLLDGFETIHDLWEKYELNYERQLKAGIDPGPKLEQPPGIRTKTQQPQGVSSPLKARVYDIPDELVEGYLINDVESIMRVYTHSVGADLSLMEAFGTPDLNMALQKAMSDIEQDYARLRADATPEQVTRLLKDERRDKDIVQAFWDRHRGTYKLPMNPDSTLIKTGRIVRVANYLSLMGGVTLSSISDAGRVVMVHGVTNTLKHGLVPLFTNLQSVRLNAKQWQLAGAITDLLLDSRIADSESIFRDFAGGRMDRGLSHAQGAFSKLTMLPHWTAFQKEFAGMVTQGAMMDAIERVVNKTASEKDLFRLANSYVDEQMANRIWQQVNTHGERHGNMWILNAGAWDDIGARRAIQAGVSKDIEKIIVTPGAEKPLWMSTEWGKLIGQFKSFSFAAKQRVLMSAMQDFDMATVNGIVFMTSLGILSNYIKSLPVIGSGRDTSQLRLVDWVEEGIDRAGLLGWFMDANNTLEKLSGGGLGLSPMMGKDPNSRYVDRNPTDALLGPAAGRLEDGIRVLQDVARGKPGNGTVKAARRLMPLQNLFWLRGLFDQVEDGVRDALGIEEPASKTE